MSDFYNTQELKARKCHVCDICDREILIGELYLYVSQVYDGMWSNHHLHQACDDINCSIPSWDSEEVAYGDVLRYCEEDIEDVDGRWRLKGGE